MNFNEKTKQNVIRSQTNIIILIFKKRKSLLCTGTFKESNVIFSSTLTFMIKSNKNENNHEIIIVMLYVCDKTVHKKSNNFNRKKGV